MTTKDSVTTSPDGDTSSPFRPEDDGSIDSEGDDDDDDVSPEEEEEEEEESLDDDRSVKNNESSSISSSLLSKVAVLGDSPLALFFSLVLLFVAVIFSWYLREQDALSPEERAYQKLGPVPRPFGEAVIYEINTTTAVVDQITDAMKKAYRYDGVLAVRGLISPSLLSDLQEASDQLIQEQHYTTARKRFKVRGKQFFTVQHGVVFRTPESMMNRTIQRKDDEVVFTIMDNPFLRLVIQTGLPQVAATLLHPTMMDESTGGHHSKANLRLLRDIFLAKDDDPYVCGWHVDDHGFWPALADAPGINAWVALDDYNENIASPSCNDRDQEGGGFALAVGSHAAPWRHEAYRVTGAAPTVPPEGFSSAADMVQRREGSGTCNVAHAAPHLQRRLEETKRVYRDLQAGDVIFHARFLFHRTIPQSDTNRKIRRRYSIRMGPGSSVIPPGFGTEPSVLFYDEHGGRTSDQVSATWPWYPRVWPTADSVELEAWKEFSNSIYPEAVKKQTARKQELKPHLQSLAQRQQIHPQASNRLFDFSEGYT